jgi:sugar lactone lactonase YvrE
VVEIRDQVAQSIVFSRGEGAWCDSGFVYFTTTVDNQIWAYDISALELTIIYDDDFFDSLTLTGADNITVSPCGDIFVAEDGGDLQLVLIEPDGSTVTLVELAGHEQSEVTGPAFSPDGERLYFSSQREMTGTGSGGITYEISGPF